jgi:hypothetical protein
MHFVFTNKNKFCFCFYKLKQKQLKENITIHSIMEQFNIVELIEHNPIAKLNGTYNSNLLTKIQNSFSDFEQQLFLSSFYCYLNCHPTNDFVIDLDDVWKWLGFNQKENAKRLLDKCFTIDKDYKVLLCFKAGQTNDDVNDAKNINFCKKKGSGGHNKQTNLLNIKTFKSLCLKAGTKKADEIHEYYLKMEEIIQEVISEENETLKEQLIHCNIKNEEQLKQIEAQEIIVKKEKEMLKEKTLLDQFPINTQCIYIGLIDNKTLGIPGNKMYQETVIKFGQSNNLIERVKTHKKTFDNFRLYNAYKVKNKIEIENCIKKHHILKHRVRNIIINDISHRELIALDDDNFSIDKVETIIKEIIKENEYNIENYNLILKKNEELQNQIYKLSDELDEKNKLIDSNSKKIQNLEYDITDNIKDKIKGTNTICKYGYYLYAYQYENMRFICSITRQKDFDTLCVNLKNLHPNGELIYKHKCSYPLSEKNMTFILKQNSISLGQNKFELSIENITKIIDTTVKLEELLINKSNDIDTLSNILSNNDNITLSEAINPEVPIVRKAKRSIDQINKDTGEVINTYDSIESAGRSLGLTTGTAIGIALREKRICKGFLWRYSGVSKEEQYAEQPVIKICCKNGEQTCFKNIALAAKDAKISAPALRNRILTDVHVNNYHWVFNKTALHYI